MKEWEDEGKWEVAKQIRARTRPNTEGDHRDGGRWTGHDNFDTLTFRKSSHAPNKFFQKLRFLRIKNRLSEILTLKFWRM